MIRYEDLRADPGGVLADLCDDLGIATTSERVREIADDHSFEGVPESRRGDGERIRRAEPGSWRQNLSPAERAAVSRIIGPKLRELGYEPDGGARLPRAA